MCEHRLRKHSAGTIGHGTALPDFLLVVVALVNSMRLSLMKAAHVALSSAARQEIRVRRRQDMFAPAMAMHVTRKHLTPKNRSGEY